MHTIVSARRVPMTTHPQIRLAHLFTATIEVGKTERMGSGPLGERRRVPILGGFFEGERMEGRVLAGGQDWQLLRSDDVTVLDAQYALETPDGTVIRVVNRGFRRGPRSVMERLAAGNEVAPDEYYFRASPVFDAPVGRYGWLNSSLFVSTGERFPDHLGLHVYEIL
jgi:hypothetical protein